MSSGLIAATRSVGRARREGRSAFPALAHLLIGLLIAAVLSAPANARELRLSHQWPETDARHRAARVLVAELKKRIATLSISIHPNSSLVSKPAEQYDALLAGQIEMAVYPIPYAAVKIPELAIGLLPGVPADVESAALLKGTDFEEKLQQLCEEKGFRILTWWWNGGGFASRSKPIGGPETVKGLNARASDNGFGEMFTAAGANLMLMSSNDIRSSMETGKLDVTITSYESLMSFRISDLAKFATLGGLSLRTAFSPVIIAKTVWDSLSDEERSALEEAAEAANVYFEATQREAEQAAIETFTRAGGTVQALTFEEYAAWLRLAKEGSWKSYQNISPRARELFLSLLQSFVDSGKR
jgi:TRAP-type C4-dicarboxylate transport system substrate-binding protein